MANRNELTTDLLVLEVERLQRLLQEAEAKAVAVADLAVEVHAGIDKLTAASLHVQVLIKKLRGETP